MSDMRMGKGKGKLSLKCKALLGALALKDKEIIMSDMCIGNEKGRLRSKVLLGALALAVMVGLGTGVYAASANKSADKSLSGQTSIFDPFKLTKTMPTTLRTPFRPVPASNLGDPQPMILLGEITNLTHTMPTVRIPFRPVLRSCFRPGFIFQP
jgi:hypothetical protein